LILDDVGELLGYVGGVDLDVLLFEVGSFEGQLVEDFFENGVEAARADIFGLLVDTGGETGDGGDGVIGENQFYTFCFQQGDGLLEQRVFWLGENADEIFFLQGLQFYANGQATLQFWN